MNIFFIFIFKTINIKKIPINIKNIDARSPDIIIKKTEEDKII